MIIVINHKTIYGFPSIEAYREFAIFTEGAGRTCRDDRVHDVTNEAAVSPENLVFTNRLVSEILQARDNYDVGAL